MAGKSPSRSKILNDTHDLMTLMTYMGISTSHKSSQMHIFAHFIEENEQNRIRLVLRYNGTKSCNRAIKAFSPLQETSK